ncbi:unnamed protein product, partial [Amoebophrya sp. A120]
IIQHIRGSEDGTSDEEQFPGDDLPGQLSESQSALLVIRPPDEHQNGELLTFLKLVNRQFLQVCAFELADVKMSIELLIGFVTTFRAESKLKRMMKEFTSYTTTLVKCRTPGGAGRDERETAGRSAAAPPRRTTAALLAQQRDENTNSPEQGHAQLASSNVNTHCEEYFFTSEIANNMLYQGIGLVDETSEVEDDRDDKNTQRHEMVEKNRIKNTLGTKLAETKGLLRRKRSDFFGRYMHVEAKRSADGPSLESDITTRPAEVWKIASRVPGSLASQLIPSSPLFGRMSLSPLLLLQDEGDGGGGDKDNDKGKGKATFASTSFPAAASGARAVPLPPTSSTTSSPEPREALLVKKPGLLPGVA